MENIEQCLAVTFPFHNNPFEMHFPQYPFSCHHIENSIPTDFCSPPLARETHLKNPQ